MCIGQSPQRFLIILWRLLVNFDGFSHFECPNISTLIEIKEGVFKNQKAIIQKIHNNKIELLLGFLNLKLVLNK